ncbi:MAG: AAA family ATPase, partial [Halanaerobium sp.]
MLKIPYGLSSFAELRKDNYFYADKTKYIEVLESYGEKYIFFLRPRRFGKTLFLSTLENYYDLNKKEKFDELFSNLYIGENKTELANSYHILRFDFSSVATTSEDELLYTFLVKVQKAIEVFIRKYKLELQCPESHDPASMLNLFLARVQNEIEQDIYVLIDEYDQFANEMLGEENSKFKKAVSQTGFVRRFYQALKEGTADGVVDRIFATGVSPITLDSMTSGFNIAAKLTREPELNEMMGFTTEELKPLLQSIKIPGAEKNELMAKLKEYYNGYLFHQDAQSKVFNSDMVLYFFKHYLRQHKEPEALIDSN